MENCTVVDLAGLTGLEGPGVSGEEGGGILSCLLFFFALGLLFSVALSWSSRESARAAPDLEEDRLRFGLFSPLESFSDLSSVLPVMRDGLGVS